MNVFPITLTRRGAWIIQQTIKPGVPLGREMAGSPVYLWQQQAHALREKVNNTILRFEDEPETLDVDIDITAEEAWLLDQNLPIETTDGANILLQIFRGLWSIEHPELPTRMVQEPPLGLSKDIVKDMLETRWDVR